MTKRNHHPSDKTATLVEHLMELKKRLIICTATFLIIFILCYVYAENIYGFLVKPLADIYHGQEGRRLIYTGLTEAFFTYMKIAFYTALFLAFPIFATQLYIFLAPGLYKKERKVLFPYLFACPTLFIFGAAIVYYWIFPLAWQFFLSFETANIVGEVPIELEARVSEYLMLVIHLMFAFGIAFQLPIILTLLVKVEMVSTETLRQKRKFAILFIAIAAAVLTPPDIISQIGLALPLFLLYECSILTCQRIERQRHA